MISVVSTAVATGAVVYAGRTAQGKKIDIKIAVGAGAFAIGLSLMSNADEKMASQFGLIVLFTACFYYLPTIAKKLGWYNGPVPADIGTPQNITPVR